MKNYEHKFLVTPKVKIKLRSYDPSYRGKYESDEIAKPEIEKYLAKIDSLQYLMYAENKNSMLIVLQGLDAAGKDGVIRHILTGLNPQGCTVERKALSLKVDRNMNRIAPKFQMILQLEKKTELPMLVLCFIWLCILIKELALCSRNSCLGHEIRSIFAPVPADSRTLRRTRGRRGAGYALALTIMVIFAGAAGMLSFEKSAGQPFGIHTYPMALWWTAMQITNSGSYQASFRSKRIDEMKVLDI